MKANLQKIRKKRVYAEDFKKEIVSIFESGKLSVIQIEKLYNINNKSIYDWIYKYSKFNEKGSRVVEMKASNINKLKELETRLQELERIVGQKQIKIDYLEKLIEIADKELGADIKKNSNIKPSNGLDNTEKN